ncbi:GNAT family N-acetyltransferase [Aphanothece hegewaldii CCALA 016]|uniref:GNAT family N-acetyltransferase n=1 Tax=Aphanothece hegewaldii CCALA 016 TaxID=2107694 RepID=A0A2T1LS12_9CHRO|nr:GNAT family N-acetyltransferase [Aphanothece hegewaldii]PSF32113.1 GNAT family N-acetyltransferase [Aphanothece hegewaldii CCALA 016]
MTEYLIKTMNREEIDLAIAWAALEGWNPGLHDADCFYTADPNGFWVGLLDNEPISVLSTVKYGDDFAFLGFYIVKPEYRGQGYGFKLWNTALESLKGRNIGLDGVLAQQENYEKSGFQFAHRNIRYEGKGGIEVPHQKEIIELKDLTFDYLCVYNGAFFPSDRTSFLQCWINQPESFALGILENSQLAGYGVIRACQTGYKIGPLFADNETLAESLFLALQSKIKPDTPIFLDTPEVNPTAIKLAERHGMKIVFETARMYTRNIPELPFERWFGVTTFELG